MRRTTFMEIIWKLHRFIYRASRGRVGGAIGGTPVLLLITTGRRSGEPRPVTLTYFEDGERFVVVASNAGRIAIRLGGSTLRSTLTQRCR